MTLDIFTRFGRKGSTKCRLLKGGQENVICFKYIFLKVPSQHFLSLPHRSAEGAEARPGDYQHHSRAGGSVCSGGVLFQIRHTTQQNFNPY